MAVCGPPIPVAGTTRIRFNGYDLSHRTDRQHPLADVEVTLLKRSVQAGSVAPSRHCEEA